MPDCGSCGVAIVYMKEGFLPGACRPFRAVRCSYGYPESRVGYTHEGRLVRKKVKRHFDTPDVDVRPSIRPAVSYPLNPEAVIIRPSTLCESCSGVGELLLASARLQNVYYLVRSTMPVSCTSSNLSSPCEPWLLLLTFKPK